MNLVGTMFLIRVWMLLISIGLIQLHLFYAEDNDCSNGNNGRIVYSTIIAEKVKPPEDDVDKMRIYNYVHNFTSSIFRGIEPSIDIHFIAPIYARSCDDNNLSNEFDKGHGSNLAHIAAWDSFWRSRRSCGLESNDILIVFEYDALPGRPDAGEITIEAVKSMTTDFMFLGYCYHKPHHHPLLNKQAPYCLHAYAMTLRGAKIMLDEMDACGPFADVQVARAIDKGIITCSYINATMDLTYLDNFYRSEGIHPSGSFHYDGLYLQVKHILNGTVGHNFGQPRTIWLLVDGYWRRIENMDTFEALGLRQDMIINFTPPQFEHFPEGEPIKIDT